MLAANSLDFNVITCNSIPLILFMFYGIPYSK